MMNLQGVVGVLFVLIAASAVVRGTSDCNVSSIKECPAYRHFEQAAGDPQSYIIRISNTNDLDGLCKNREEMKDCIASHSCTVDEFDADRSSTFTEQTKNVTAKRYFATMDYACSEDVKPVFVQHMKCIYEGDDQDFKMNLRRCSAQHYKAGDCASMKEYFKCFLDEVTKGCNDAVADVYVNTLKKLEPDPCPKNDAGGTTFQHFAPIWMASCVGWLLLTRWMTSW